MSSKKIPYIAMVALLEAYALAACAAGSPSQITTGGATDGAGGGPSTSTGSGGGGSLSFSVGSGGGVPSPSCSAATDKLVYVLTAPEGTAQEQTLRSFDPATLAFHEIGMLHCPLPQGSHAFASSMSIDRQGTAWVVFSDDTLYQVDTGNGHCAATAFQPTAAMIGVPLKIGFASDTPGGATDTAYLSTPKGIAELDQQTLQTTAIGNFDVDLDPTCLDCAPTLTGTGEGRLFGVFPAPPTLTEIDKSDAHIISSTPLPSDVNKGFAAVLWGGDLWIFGNPVGNNGSVVFQYDLSTHTTTTAVPATGFTVIGAGVSTCAPYKPPA